MKEYKLVLLNEGLKLSRKKDIEQAEKCLNDYVSGGWELQQIVTPSDLAGALVGVFYKENQLQKWMTVMEKNVHEQLLNLENRILEDRKNLNDISKDIGNIDSAFC